MDIVRSVRVVTEDFRSRMQLREELDSGVEHYRIVVETLRLRRFDVWFY